LPSRLSCTGQKQHLKLCRRICYHEFLILYIQILPAQDSPAGRQAAIAREAPISSVALRRFPPPALRPIPPRSPCPAGPLREGAKSADTTKVDGRVHAARLQHPFRIAVHVTAFVKGLVPQLMACMTRHNGGESCRPAHAARPGLSGGCRAGGRQNATLLSPKREKPAATTIATDGRSTTCDEPLRPPPRQNAPCSLLKNLSPSRKLR
jgi:hypothetical protein